MNPILFVDLLTPNARLPLTATEGSAGYDLFAATDGMVEPFGRLLVPTDIAIALPKETFGSIASRSSLALKNGIVAFPGVIDSDYRGPVGILLMNHSKDPFRFAKHDRIAQLIVYSIQKPEIVQVVKLQETKRGTGGFGSTGV
jgi:dUTP pyrophosphatase